MHSHRRYKVPKYFHGEQYFQETVFSCDTIFSITCCIFIKYKFSCFCYFLVRLYFHESLFLLHCIFLWYYIILHNNYNTIYFYETLYFHETPYFLTSPYNLFIYINHNKISPNINHWAGAYSHQTVCKDPPRILPIQWMFTGLYTPFRIPTTLKLQIKILPLIKTIEFFSVLPTVNDKLCMIDKVSRLIEESTFAEQF